jgi:four helix bundle protein
VNHLGIALGSLGELRALFEIAHRLGYVTDDQCRAVNASADTVGRLLFGLRRSLQDKPTPD